MGGCARWVVVAELAGKEPMPVSLWTSPWGWARVGGCALGVVVTEHVSQGPMPVSVLRGWGRPGSQRIEEKGRAFPGVPVSEFEKLEGPQA